MFTGAVALIAASPDTPEGETGEVIIKSECIMVGLVELELVLALRPETRAE
jgi:hypothetical protein